MSMLGPTKTGRPRILTLTGDLADTVESLAKDGTEGAWLFPTSQGNAWRHGDFHTERWQPALKIAGLTGRTPHAPALLRCLVSGDGIPIQRVSEALGHTSITTTWDVYGGVMDARNPATARVMQARMSNPAGSERDKT